MASVAPAGGRVALLTGATGFVGSRVAGGLVRDGWEVHAIVRPQSRLPSQLQHERVEAHVHDGTTEGLAAVVERIRPSTVFHMAASYAAEHRAEHVTPLVTSNVHFGTQLLDAMRSSGCRHLVNTGTVFQHYGGDVYNPVNLYAATKQAFEDIVRYYVEAHGFAVTTLELTDTYGRDDPRDKLLGVLRRAIVEKSTIELSPGDQVVDLVHIEDVVSAYLIAGNRLLPTTAGRHEHYAIQSGEAVTLRQLVALVEEITGTAIRAIWGARAYRKREVMTIPHLAPRLPGWAPSHRLRQGLEEVLK